MSIWTSLRDSVESAAGAGVKAVTGLSITPALSVGAGGTPPATSAAPSGAVANGGVPNVNPQIFKGLDNTYLYIAAGFVILLLLLKRG